MSYWFQAHHIGLQQFYMLLNAHRDKCHHLSPYDITILLTEFPLQFLSFLWLIVLFSNIACFHSFQVPGKIILSCPFRDRHDHMLYFGWHNVSRSDTYLFQEERSLEPVIICWGLPSPHTSPHIQYHSVQRISLNLGPWGKIICTETILQTAQPAMVIWHKPGGEICFFKPLRFCDGLLR